MRKIMDIRYMLERMAGRFDVDMQVKAMLAGCFIGDGDDRTELFCMGWRSRRNGRSYRAKLFVNLRMAIECYLKALVITHSEDIESPEDAYANARKASHGLASLLQSVQSRSNRTRNYFRKASHLLVAKIDSLAVRLRYELDVVAEFSKETFSEQFFENGHLSGTIDSEEWMLCLLDHAHYFGNKARRAFQQNLDDHSAAIGANDAKRATRIEKFLRNLKFL